MSDAVVFVVLAFMATVGSFFVKSANFTPWNASGESAINAIGGGMAIALFSVFGIVPTSSLAKATAPFSDAANSIFGGTWAGNVMALAVIISGFGALNGWTMICAEMPLAAANDGLFPERFKRMSKNQVPSFGIITSTVLATVSGSTGRRSSWPPARWCSASLSTWASAATWRSRRPCRPTDEAGQGITPVRVTTP